MNLDFLSPYTEYLQNAGTIGLVIALIVYLALCLFGYKLWRFWMGLIGLSFGFCAGVLLGGCLPGMFGFWGPLLLGLIVGILCAWFSVAVQSVGLFVGVLLCVFGAVFSLFPKTLVFWGLVVAGVVGLTAAVLAVRYRFGVIAAVTGAAGGLLAADTFFALIQIDNTVLSFVAGLILAMAGIAVQLSMNKDRNKGS